jgi:hypothetical protein
MAVLKSIFILSQPFALPHDLCFFGYANGYFLLQISKHTRLGMHPLGVRIFSCIMDAFVTLSMPDFEQVEFFCISVET